MVEKNVDMLLNLMILHFGSSGVHYDLSEEVLTTHSQAPLAVAKSLMAINNYIRVVQSMSNIQIIHS
jgi:hypothetical protein